MSKVVAFDAPDAVEDSTAAGAAAVLSPTSKALAQAKAAGAHEKKETVSRARAQVKEMMIYGCFVLLFTFQTLYGQNDQVLFHFTDNLRIHLVESEFLRDDAHIEKVFKDVAAIEELYQFLKGPFFEVVYGPATYDGDWSFNETLPPGSTSFVNRRGWLVGGARIMGGIRFGQIRVKPRACNLPSEIVSNAANVWQCVEDVDISAAALQSDPFGKPAILTNLQRGSVEEPAFVSPNTGGEFAAPNVWHMLPNTDPNSNDPATSVVLQALKTLEENKFVDQYSRVVMIDMNLYNPNLDYVCVVRLLLEATGGAGYIPYKDYTADDNLRFAVEIVVLLIVIGYTVVEVRMMLRKGVFSHILSKNLPHMLNLVLFYVATFYRLRAFIALPDALEASSNEYIDLRTPVDFSRTAKNINAFNAFLTWIKVFKYLHFIPRFRILLGTVEFAASKIGVFFVICAIVLFGSAQGFALAFGTNIKAYRNLTQSFFTLTRSLLGDFDFEELRQENPFLGPLMFFLFTLLAVFVLLNMFIALIMDAYEEMKAQLLNEKDVTANDLGKEVGNVIFEDGLYRLPFCGKHFRRAGENAKKTIRATIDSLPSHTRLNMLLRLSDRNFDGDVSPYEVAEQLDANADGQVSTQELYLALLEVGATPQNARQAVEAVDVNNNGVVSTSELRKLVAKIKANHDNTVVTIGNNGNTLDMHVDDVSSSESEDDIVPGLPRVRKQRRTRDSESKQGGEAKLWNGIDNHSALRAINSVRLDLLKKKALLEQLESEEKDHTDRELILELKQQTDMLLENQHRMENLITSLVTALGHKHILPPQASPVRGVHNLLRSGASRYNLMGMPARTTFATAAATSTEQGGSQPKVSPTGAGSGAAAARGLGTIQGSLDSLHSVSKSDAYQRMVKHDTGGSAAPADGDDLDDILALDVAGATPERDSKAAAATGGNNMGPKH